MLLITEITVPKRKDAAAFAAFMRDEYIPAVDRRQTRVGMVEELELLQRGETETNHAFLWLLRWNGVDPGPMFMGFVDDEAVRGKFEQFGARMKPHVRWTEVGRSPDPLAS